MSTPLCAGSMLQCSFGAFSTPLRVLPVSGVFITTPMARITDCVPSLNIASFGMCRSPSNPAVAAATALSGVPTPMPCQPVVAAPWMPGSPTVLVGGVPALQSDSKAVCNWGGIIQSAMAGSFLTQVP